MILQSALVDECEKMTGARLTSRVWCMVADDVCDRSTIRPKRFISRTMSCSTTTTTENKKIQPLAKRSINFKRLVNPAKFETRKNYCADLTRATSFGKRARDKK